MAAVWVAAETGILKGVDLNKKEFRNYGELSSLNKSDEICRTCWSDGYENKIFVALKSGKLKMFDVAKQDYVQELSCFKPEDGLITGLEREESTLLACCQSGLIRVLKDSNDEKTDIKVGNHIARMRQNPFQTCQVATGGDENALKLWDLSNTNQPIFKAKNVRNDQLDLCVPIYVKDIGFLSSSGSLPKIVVGTAYHKLRLYDPKAQKRPVMDISYKESPITCISIPAHEKFIILGNTYGDMAAVDIRNGKNLGSYKSFAGSICDIQCHKSEPFVASCGLDRCLRIHHIDTRQLIDKETCQARSTDVKTKRKLDRNDKNESCEESDEEDIWNAMDVVEDETSSLKRKKLKKKGPSNDS